MKNSAIQWTDHTFNPWIGCTKVSPGCAHCYAEARDQRFAGGIHWGKGQPRKRTSGSNWKEPLKWNAEAAKAESLARQGAVLGSYQRPRVFCASLADWLDNEVPIEWLIDLLALIDQTPNLDWLLLTKRPENFVGRITAATHGKMNPFEVFRLMPNIWVGTTVENQEMAEKRIPALLQIPAKVRFLSCEPLLEAVSLDQWIKPFLCCKACGESYDLDERIPDSEHPHGKDECARCGHEGFMTSCWGEDARYHFDKNGIHTEAPEPYGGGIHWVICGGESGPEARPMHPDWARSLRDQCTAAGVPFFFKQWGEWFPGFTYDDGFIFHEEHGTPELKDGQRFKGFQFPPEENGEYQEMGKIGKKLAGRILVRREWNEFPRP